MAWSFSAALKAAMFGEATADGIVPLITITHATLNPPLRFVADAYAITSRGHVYEAAPFDILIPDDQEDQSAVAKLTVDNVSRRLIPVLRAISNAALCQIEFVKFSDHDTVEKTIPNLQITAVSVPDMMSLVCDLTVPDASIARYGTARFTPALYPALARAA